MIIMITLIVLLWGSNLRDTFLMLMAKRESNIGINNKGRKMNQIRSDMNNKERKMNKKKNDMKI